MVFDLSRSPPILPILDRSYTRVEPQQIFLHRSLVHLLAIRIIVTRPRRSTLWAEKRCREVEFGKLGIFGVPSSQPGVNHIVRLPQVEKPVFWSP